jgi:hypothetical protein
MVFSIFGCLLVKKLQNEVSAYFHEIIHLQIVKTLTLFRELVHWRKSNNESIEKPEQKFDVAFGTMLRISKFFKEARTNFV